MWKNQLKLIKYIRSESKHNPPVNMFCMLGTQVIANPHWIVLVYHLINPSNVASLFLIKYTITWLKQVKVLNFGVTWSTSKFRDIPVSLHRYRHRFERTLVATASFSRNRDSIPTIIASGLSSKLPCFSSPFLSY